MEKSKKIRKKENMNQDKRCYSEDAFVFVDIASIKKDKQNEKANEQKESSFV